MSTLKKINVLIAHADAVISAGLLAILEKQCAFDPVTAGPCLMREQDLIARAISADLIVADYDSGLRLAACVDTNRNRVVILTHSDSEAKICHGLEQGVRGFILLGGSLEELISSLKSVHSGDIALGASAVVRIADRMKQKTLTRREGEILRQMMLGLSNKGIALKLTIAVGTVKTHVKSILDKLDATSRTQAASIAQRRGILGEESDGSTGILVPTSRRVQISRTDDLSP